MTNKNKQNIRYAKVCERINKKKRYDGLSPNEVKYIKSKLEYETVDKELNYFYANCKRLNNNGIDWNSLNECELDRFDYIYKKSEKLLKKMSKLSDLIDVDRALDIYRQLNTNSVSF